MKFSTKIKWFVTDFRLFSVILPLNLLPLSANLQAIELDNFLIYASPVQIIEWKQILVSRLKLCWLVEFLKESLF
jgi:hypothetical protein